MPWLVSSLPPLRPRLTNSEGQWPWAERGKGGDGTLNGKDAARGISLPFQSPLYLHASMPVFSSATLAADAWMAMGHSHLLAGRAGLSA